MPVFTVTSTGVKALPTNPFIVKSIRWIGTGATAAGNAVRLEDTGSNLLWRSIAAGTWNLEESITQRQWFNGLNVITLDSGVLDIEYEENKGQTYY